MARIDFIKNIFKKPWMLKERILIKSYKKSIFKRWIINSLVTTVVLLLIGGITYGILMQNYYYNAAKQLMLSRANFMVDTLVNVVAQDMLNINNELKKYIENFDDKNKMEIQAININGDVELSSTGYMYEKNLLLKDYENALISPNSMGEYVGKSQYNEKIMAISIMMPYLGSEYSAIRYVISLEKIDNQITLLLVIYFCFAAVILLFMLITGMYFVRSIISPIKQVENVAKKIAMGEMNIRIEKQKDDEIGQLCLIINDMADKINTTNQMKNEFLSSVSHELRTPLTAIKGWAETIMKEIDINDPIYIKGINVIKNETSRLSVMVEELLDFSRLQDGRLVLNKEKIDILAEIEEAVIVYESKIKQENKKLIYNCSANIATVYGDKNRLRQVFINLIDNAVKYTDENDIIEVDVHLKDNNIVVTIKDTGCGIAPKDVPFVKEKFFKANNTRKGSGIGLSMVDDIVKMHCGTVDVSSRYNIGTTITIKIPIMDS